MKGIILSGGSGTRLMPLTKVTSKQLLPVYDRPMILYPLNTLLKAGIRDILVIIAPDHAIQYKKLLSDGRQFGANITYKIQKKPQGLAQAFILGEKFIGKDSVCMILGDNIFEDDFSRAISEFKSGGHVFAKKVSDPERFGVVKFSKTMRAEKIEEKPKKYLSDFAITGLYLYDNRVVKIAKDVKPSKRGELEITDLHNWYLKQGELKVDIVKGAWLDAGTFESLFLAGELMRQKALLTKSK